MLIKFHQSGDDSCRSSVCNKEGNNKSEFHENLEEETNVTLSIDRETYEKIVNVSNIRTMRTHQIKQPGYQEARNCLY